MRQLSVVLRPGGGRALLAVLCGLSGCVPGEKGQHVSTLAPWKVAMEPALSAGAVGSSATVAFHQITTAVRLSDGRIVVADGGLSSRLAVLSPDGGSLRTIGRHGAGPGEYQWITSLQAGADDSLYVFDAAQQRLTAFTNDGRLGRTARFQGAGYVQLRSVSRLTDGVWFGRGLDRPRPGPVDQIVRDTIAVGLLDAALSRMEVLTHLPTLMSMTFSVHGQTLFGAALFSPTALHATWGRCVFLSTGEDPQIEVYTDTGEHVASIRAPGTQRPVTPEAVGAWVRTRLDRGATAEDTAIAEAKGRVNPPEHLPYFYQMVVDQWGDVWLEEYSPPLGSGGRWHVLTQTGQDMGVAVMPPRLGVFEISARGVLGATTGEFDEPIIVVFPLISHPGEAPSVIPACQTGPRQAAGGTGAG